jgi:hypothetical protein
MSQEVRTPLDQPEGFEGVQVDFLDNNGEISMTKMVSRFGADGVVYLGMSFMGNQHMPDSIKEKDLLRVVPRMEFGWEITLDAESFFEKVKTIVDQKRFKKYDWLLIEPDDPSHGRSKDIEDALKYDRKRICMVLGQPNEGVEWDNWGAVGSRRGVLHTSHTLAMAEPLITSLMQETAPPEKYPEMIAMMDPLKEFYRQYVEIDFH